MLVAIQNRIVKFFRCPQNERLLTARRHLREANETISALRLAIPTLESLISGQSGGWTEYRCVTGRYRARPLLYLDEVAVAEGMADAETELETHHHAHATEWILLVSGRARVSMDNEVVEMYPGTMQEIPVAAEHVLSFAKDSRLIAMTMPADNGFPRD